MYHSIVVGTDGSDAALGAVSRAIDLYRAGPVDCIVHVVTSYVPLSAGQMSRIRSAIPAGLHGRVTSDLQAREALDTATCLLREANVSHTTTESTDAPFDAILQLAGDVDADVIVIGRRGLGAGQRLVLGGISSRLAREAPVDVLITRQASTSDSVNGALARLGEAVSRFETDHPELVKTVSDVSYHLSGMGI
jgi:nucleotide-binding universal stress UspA family protein